MKFNFLSESDQAYYIHKASTLVEALPYIRTHTGKNFVIKYGGHAMGDQSLAENFSRDVGLLKEVGINPIIVHGGGPQIDNDLKKINIKSNFVDGLRITNHRMIKVIKEVLYKKINPEIVTRINKTGGRAVSLSGHKKNLIKAKKIQKKMNQDFGFVGVPYKIEKKIINQQIKKNLIPVISPLGIDSKKNIYNINADTAAGSVASELKANKLLLLTDVPGILDQNKKLISSLSISDAKKIIKKKFISGGMRPKIQTCIDAIDKGVKQATILDGRIPHSLILELFTEHGIGTQIYS